MPPHQLVSHLVMVALSSPGAVIAIVIASAGVACATRASSRPSGWLRRSRTASRSNSVLSSPAVHHALRLRCGDDLVNALAGYCARQRLSSASITTCVGSLSALRLRLAGACEFLELREPLEIVSLVGTISECGKGFHLHAAVSRADGSVVGGHIKGAATVATTAEVILAALPALTFSREARGGGSAYARIVRNGAPLCLSGGRDDRLPRAGHTESLGREMELRSWRKGLAAGCTCSWERANRRRRRVRALPAAGRCPGRPRGARWPPRHLVIFGSKSSRFHNVRSYVHPRRPARCQRLPYL